MCRTVTVGSLSLKLRAAEKISARQLLFSVLYLSARGWSHRKSSS